MATANTDSDAQAAIRTHVKSGTRKLAKFVMTLIFASLLFVMAQTGWVVRFNIWSLSLWWLLPLGTLAVIVMSFVRDFFRTGRENLPSFDWDRFSKHPVRTVKAYRRRNRTSDATWQAFRNVFLKKIRNRILCLIVPLVLFASFLFLIFSNIAMSIWVFVAGNQNFGYKGFGMFGIFFILVMTVFAVFAYWQLLHHLRRIADGVRFPIHRLVKIIVYTALVPLTFILSIGCSITINSGF